MKEPNRLRKTEIKYQASLTEEQKLAKAGVYEKDISIFLGNFGSGKTYCATVCALDLLFKGHMDKIYITRPIDFKATGYLTGSAQEKMYFHTLPIKLNLYAAYKKEIIDKLFSEGKIEIIPIDYMKGMTFMNSITIVDEFEDIDYEDFKLILTRLGKDSKLIFTGSEEQIDTKSSCIPLIKRLSHFPLVNYHTFTSQHRNDDIQKIINYIENGD